MGEELLISMAEMEQSVAVKVVLGHCHAVVVEDLGTYGEDGEMRNSV